MSTAHDRLNAVLAGAQVSKTIYSLVMPETEAAVDFILDGDQQAIVTEALTSYFNDRTTTPDIPQLTGVLRAALSQGREGFRSMYREAWTQKQDAAHEGFFATWKRWNAPIVQADWSQFPHMYPTGGASEGLRVAIDRYAIRARAEGFEPIIHVFDGEYEGFNAYAASAGIKVITHNRTQWRDNIDTIGPQDQFYISQPSAIDGNIWPDFEEFAGTLNQKQPKAQLILDLTYVGCVAKDFQIKADFPNIPVIVFSLSKPAGAYYHRIGGYLAREPEPALIGNKWFKNLLALRLGTEMMDRHGVHELPRKYSPVQAQAIARVNRDLRMDLKPSDVFVLGTMKPRADATDLERYLTRGSEGEALVRVCLTPMMAGIIDPRLNTTVRARPHEGLEEPRL